MTTQYENPKLWTLASDKAGKDYVSVPAALSSKWAYEKRADGTIVRTSGEYEIIGVPYGNMRTYTVRRQGVELPLSFTGSLMGAKAHAAKNAAGKDRMHVA